MSTMNRLLLSSYDAVESAIESVKSDQRSTWGEMARKSRRKGRAKDWPRIRSSKKVKKEEGR